MRGFAEALPGGPHLRLRQQLHRRHGACRDARRRARLSRGAPGQGQRRAAHVRRHRRRHLRARRSGAAPTTRPTRPRWSTRSSPSASTWWSARGAARSRQRLRAPRDQRPFGERTFDWLYRHFFGGAVNDIGSGYRAFTRRFVKSFPAISTGFDVEIELSMHASQLMIPVAEIGLDRTRRQRDRNGAARDLASDSLRIGEDAGDAGEGHAAVPLLFVLRRWFSGASASL